MSPNPSCRSRLVPARLSPVSLPRPIQTKRAMLRIVQGGLSSVNSTLSQTRVSDIHSSRHPSSTNSGGGSASDPISSHLPRTLRCQLCLKVSGGLAHTPWGEPWHRSCSLHPHMACQGSPTTRLSAGSALPSFGKLIVTKSVSQRLGRIGSVAGGGHPRRARIPSFPRYG